MLPEGEFFLFGSISDRIFPLNTRPSHCAICVLACTAEELYQLWLKLTVTSEVELNK